MINTNMKYWSWMGAFSLSMLFWAELLWIITHGSLTPLRRGFHLLCHKVSPLLSIWVVIKSLRDVCVIFNIHPEENQGFATLSLRRSYVVNPTRSQ